MNTVSDFYSRLYQESKEVKSLNEAKGYVINPMIVKGKKFYQDIKNVGGDDIYWRELEKIALNRKSSSWTLEDLSDLHGYFSRFGSAGDVVRFIQDYLKQEADKVDWNDLSRFAKQIDDETDFRNVVNYMNIEGSDLKSKIIRSYLGEFVREYRGKVLGEDLNISINPNEFGVDTEKEIMDSMGNAVTEIAKEESEKILSTASKESRHKLYETLITLANEYLDGGLNSKQLIKKLEKIDRDLADGVRHLAEENEIVKMIEEPEEIKYVKLNKNVKYGEDILVEKGSVGKVIKENKKEMTVRFDDGIIVTSDKDDFEEVSKKKTKSQKYLIKAYALDNESRRSIERGYCIVCSGKLIPRSRKVLSCSSCKAMYEGLRIKAQEGVYNDYSGTTANPIGIGKAVRIEGNPASAYYGKIGLIERITEDGFIGVNLRDGNYIERPAEDLTPAPKQDFYKNIENIKSDVDMGE